MSSALEFYHLFRDAMAERRIRFVLTSGMACVEYGLQQGTKYTDWIVDPEDLDKLVAMLCEFERGLSGKNWRISYRPLFGAPLTKEYLAHGWTTHLAIHDDPLSSEHHVDIFGQPPCVPLAEALVAAEGIIAERLVVARMKKTDRDKDWSAVEGLSMQASENGNSHAVLHLRDPELLRTAWLQIPQDNKPGLLSHRPLLKEFDAPQHGLVCCLAIERALWEQTNKLRYRRYQHGWKEFLRRWRVADDFAWPSAARFFEQYRAVLKASAIHGLPLDPLGGTSGRQELLSAAQTVVAETFAADAILINAITPPLEDLLP